MVKQVTGNSAGQNITADPVVGEQVRVGRGKKKPVQRDRVAQNGEGPPVVVAHEQDSIPLGRSKATRVGSKNAKAGDHLEFLSGTVRTSATEGTFVMLDKPLKVGGELVKEIHLWGENILAGKVKLHGRLDKKEQGPAHHRTTYFKDAFSGLSNLAKGEPRFDGTSFRNADGQALEQLTDDRPSKVLAPARIYVLDRARGVAFLGASGGFIPAWQNQFHGFSGTAKIEKPTEADRSAASGAGHVPIGAGHTLDPQNHVIYGFEAGALSYVIRLVRD